MGKIKKKKKLDDWTEDGRFQHVATDPTFRSVPKKESKVLVDERFSAMFTDKDFQVSSRTDKRGRPISMNSGENLKKYYGLEKEYDVAEDIDDEASDSSMSSEDEETVLEALPFETDESIDKESLPIDLEAADDIPEPTHRLAAVQLDWDSIRATDIFVMLHSCRPQNGIVLKVTIYPSEFGMKRMNEEKIQGPSEIQSSDEKDIAKKLRRYETMKSFYYYAVVECDSADTAAYLYEQCNNMEFETTGNTLQLSFVPDDMTFEVPQEWKSNITTCTAADISSYLPKKFAVSALSQTKVDLNWDVTSKERTDYFQSLFDKEHYSDNDDDLKRLSEFVAFSSEDEIDSHATTDNSNQVNCEPMSSKHSESQKKSTLASNKKKLRKQKLREKVRLKRLEKANLLVNKGDDDDDDDTKQQMDGLELLINDGAATSMKVTPNDVEVDDRFTALYSDPNFHIDPTHPDAKRCPEMIQAVNRKRRTDLNTLDDV